MITLKYLSENDLKNQVPSVFTTQAHNKVSEKYSLIPTIECVKALHDIGFYPVKAMESRCRDSNNKPFAKHLIRFRNKECMEVGGNLPEIVLVNSHNGLSSYQLRAGIFRLVCSNGLIVGNEMFQRCVRHTGEAPQKVVEAVGEIIEVIPEVLQKAEEWKKISLSSQQKQVYAQSAALLKWEEDTQIKTEKLLSPRRYNDQKDDLWTTFNNVQENIIRGGIRYFNTELQPNGRTKINRQTTRAVNSVNENSRLNTALWNLTEKMAQIL